MKFASPSFVISISLAILSPLSAQATTILYDQDFENPTGFVNDNDDINIRNTINELYGNQPGGFTFEQAFTVETLFINGSEAFGTGYSDPSGIGGNYTLGMFSDRQADLLGLSFNIGNNDFLNFKLDISSIDLSSFLGPFLPAEGTVPVFEFTLFDNPSGARGLGSGTILDSQQATGVASPQTIFDWTEVLLPLDASNSTNGNVILRIDLLSGEYAALDNFLIVASNTAGDVGNSVILDPVTPDPTTPDPLTIPEPTTTVSLLGFTLIGLVTLRHSR